MLAVREGTAQELSLQYPCKASTGVVVRACLLSNVTGPDTRHVTCLCQYQLVRTAYPDTVDSSWRFVASAVTVAQSVSVPQSMSSDSMLRTV